MAQRDIIRIDEEKCDGCGLCVGACAEGAIALVDGKARLVSETYCDGLGACLGECPRGAITIERVEARAFDAEAVKAHLERHRPVSGPPSVSATPLPVRAHGGPHGEHAHGGGCPGSQAMAFAPAVAQRGGDGPPSALAQWPVQLHLLSPMAPYLAGADLVLAADCVAYAAGDFHARFLAGRRLAIACPKLDEHQEVYLEKLVAMIEQGGIRSLTVVVMEVPCCSGLVRLAVAAASRAGRRVPVDGVVIGIDGRVQAERRLVEAPAA